MPEPRNLSRSKDGRVIHRATCRYARVPWLWAEGATDDDVFYAKTVMGLKVCKVCQPSFRRSDD